MSGAEASVSGAEAAVGPAAAESGPTWLSIPEVADRLGVRQRDVRSAIADRRLVALRRGASAALLVPAELLVVGPDGRETILPSLRGTLIQLGDAGLTDDEAVTWLFAFDDALGDTPIAALRAGRPTSVRRAAQVL